MRGLNTFMYMSVDVQRQLKEIKRKIYLKMNGVTVEQMQRNGIHYSKNYGVSLPEIKQLAAGYSENAMLARVLWREKIRETMLMATMLCPENVCDEELAEEWAGDVNTVELAENLSKNLLCRLSFIGVRVVEWVSSENSWKCAIGFFCAAFGFDNLSEEQRYILLVNIKQNRHIENVAVCRAMALFLRKSGSVDLKKAEEIMDFVACFEDSPRSAERYIFEEVKTELVYRFGL